MTKKRKNNVKKTWNVLFIVAFVAISHARANAQTIRVESQNRIIVSTEEGDAKEPGDYNPRISFMPAKPSKAHSRERHFSTVAQGYAVGYTGISYAPIPEVEIEQSIGIETAAEPPRLQNSLFFAVGKLTGLGILEYGTQTRADLVGKSLVHNPTRLSGASKSVFRRDVATLRWLWPACRYRGIARF